MIKTRLVVFLTVVVMCSSNTFAQSNWVGEFLNRYRPLDVPAPAPPGVGQDMANMIRNGQLPLTVNGSGLTGGTVEWNGSAVSTTPGTDSQLTATIPASLVSESGTPQVTARVVADPRSRQVHRG